MIYRIFILLSFMVLVSAKTHAQDIYKVTADNLRVRASSSLDSKITGFIPQNENVMVLDSSNAKYFKVKLTNGEGWVSSEYLTRISPPAVKKVEVTKPMVLTPTGKDHSKTIFIVLAVTVMLALLFIIFKFLNNKVFMALATLIILGVGYLFYLTFVMEKSVAGKYMGSADAEFKSFEFKPNKTVVVEYANTDSIGTTDYSIEGDMLKFKQQENTILLLVRDSNTLIGEGFTRGTFSKK